MNHDHHDHTHGEHSHDSPAHHAHQHMPTTADATGAAVKDPVCGMTVDPAKTAHHAEFAGATYHFCSTGCCEKFVAEPARYAKLAPKPQAGAAVVEGTIYTCPMHPEIRQAGPGNCPI